MTLDREVYGDASGTQRGGYVLIDADGQPDVVLVGTGSEVELALSARDALAAEGIAARVVSMPCVELYLEQDQGYQSEVLPPEIPRVSIEAGVTFGWREIVGGNGACVGIDRYGASAPGAVVADKLGMNVANVVATVKQVV